MSHSKKQSRSQQSSQNSENSHNPSQNTTSDIGQTQNRNSKNCTRARKSFLRARNFYSNRYAQSQEKKYRIFSLTGRLYIRERALA